MGLVSKWMDHVENVESREPDVGAVRSRVRESLLGCSVMDREKRACRLMNERAGAYSLQLYTLTS